MESDKIDDVLSGCIASSLDEFMKKEDRENRRLKMEDHCITFTIERDEFVEKVVDFLEKNKVTITHKETRMSRDQDKVDVYVECFTSQNIEDVVPRLSDQQGVSKVQFETIPVLGGPTPDKIAWFPRSINQLDICSGNVLLCDDMLEADHPGFTDEVYKKRRAYFSEVAMNYKSDEPIPKIDYTAEETNTWTRVYDELISLYPTHACKEQMDGIALLAKNCNFTRDNVPQLDDVSRFLKDRTGFTLRPVAGFLSPRDFLAGLAFRVFNCTQYMRHSSDPLYTPEPDVCHELLGHAPLLTDPSFAQFSHEIGLASLGTSDADIKRLASCYLYTVEFGLCKENGNIRAYGAGLLSCIAEMKHALISHEKIRFFEPEDAANTESYVTTFQPFYFISDSLEQAKDKMRSFAKTIKRPFDLQYDFETDIIKILSKTDKNKEKIPFIGDTMVEIATQNCDDKMLYSDVTEVLVN